MFVGDPMGLGDQGSENSPCARCCGGGSFCSVGRCRVRGVCCPCGAGRSRVSIGTSVVCVVGMLVGVNLFSLSIPAIVDRGVRDQVPVVVSSYTRSLMTLVTFHGPVQHVLNFLMDDISGVHK